MRILGTQTSTTVAAMRSLGDAALVRGCRERKEDAWAALVERFGRYVYAIGTRAIRPWIDQFTRRPAIHRLRGAGSERLDDDAFEVVDVRATEETERLDEALSAHAAMSTLPEYRHEIPGRSLLRPGAELPRNRHGARNRDRYQCQLPSARERANLGGPAAGEVTARAASLVAADQRAGAAAAA
jgi:hypothetical protein